MVDLRRKRFVKVDVDYIYSRVRVDLLGDGPHVEAGSELMSPL